jgi:hypothetical protein
VDEYYAGVPKNFEENLKFRSQALDMAMSTPEVREELWIACSRDLLFYVNTFGWTYDPRKSKGVLPFITYPFQDEALLQIRDCVLDGRDLVVKKSRDTGEQERRLCRQDRQPKKPVLEDRLHSQAFA